MPDQNESVQCGPVSGVDDGLDAILERHRRDIGRATAATGQIHGDRRCLQVLDHSIPTRRRKIRAVHKHHAVDAHLTVCRLALARADLVGRRPRLSGLVP